MFDRLADGGLNLRRLEQIALDRKRFASADGEIVLRARELIQIPREQDDSAAFSTNLTRKHQTESARTTGNKNHFVLKRETLRSE